MTARLAPLLFAIVLAGCTGAAPDTVPSEVIVRDVPLCHAAAPAPAHDAPIVGPLQGEPRLVLLRVARFLDDPPVNGTAVETEPGRWRMDTQRGHVGLQRSAGGELFGASTYVEWWAREDHRPRETQARDTLTDLLRNLGAPMGDIIIERVAYPDMVVLQIHQTFGGVRLPDLSGSMTLASDTSLGFHAPRLLPERGPPVSDERAREVAERHGRCLLQQIGRTPEAGYSFTGTEPSAFTVHDDSLVRAVLVRFTEPAPPSHCGMSILVHVDATNATVLGAGRPPCD